MEAWAGQLKRRGVSSERFEKFWGNGVMNV
jgi:hypothetical protein